MSAAPQRVKVGVTALMGKVDAAISAREAELQRQQASYAEQRLNWFKAARAAVENVLKILEEGAEPEDIRYNHRSNNIHIDIEEEYPEDIDFENDSKLRKMRRHKGLLEMAVDTTIMIDPEGEYGSYL